MASVLGLRFLYMGLAGMCVACAGRPSPRGALRAALEADYGPETRVNVSFMRDSQHLNIILDGPPFRHLSDSLAGAKAREVGQFALERYDRVSELDSLTVRFVRFVPGAGESYCFARSTTFGVPDTTGLRDPLLILGRRVVNRGPCLLAPSLTP